MKTKTPHFRCRGSFFLFLALLWSAESGVCQTPIECGQTVTNTTTAPDQIDLYTFTGAAGQVLSVALWGPVGCPNDYMVADIYNPDGQLVVSLASDCNAGNALNLTLTYTGMHTFRVHESLYRSTGSYSLSIQSLLGGGCNAKPIQCGQTVVGNTTFRSQMDAYSYAGTAGEMLSIALWGPGCTYEYMVADIYNPDGQLVARLVPDCNTGGGLNLTLTNSGIHTILVHGYVYRSTGSYSLSIQSLLGGGCNARPIVCGQTVATNTTFPAQMDAYSYAGTAGEMLSIALWGPGCTYEYMVADIYNPDGQLVARLVPDCNTGGGLNLTLTNSGIHTILVHGYVYRSTGSYSLSIQSLLGGGCNAKPIQCGQTVVGNTTFNSEMDAFSYPGVAGQVLSISLTGPIGCPYDYMVADVYGPTGGFVTRIASLCNAGDTSSVILTNTGIHTILVHESYYRRTASYELSVTNIAGCGTLHVGSRNVRTQEVVCLPLEITPASPVVWVSFAVEVRNGVLSSPSLNVSPAFTNATITPGFGSQWLVTLQTSPTSGMTGDQIGSVCFTAISTQTVSTPVLLSNVVVTNQGGFVPGITASEGRVVVIANQPWLEAHFSPNAQRMVTLYGKADTDYVMIGSTNLGPATSWLPSWTNRVPTSMEITSSVQGPLSNAPVLFLRAMEQ